MRTDIINQLTELLELLKDSSNKDEDANYLRELRKQLTDLLKDVDKRLSELEKMR